LTAARLRLHRGSHAAPAITRTLEYRAPEQAKDLLRLYRNHDTAAIARIRNALPSAADKSDAAISALALRLHDAQSCVAREYGFQSWEDLRVYVHTQTVRGDDRAARTLRWLRLAYAGEVAGGTSRAAPLVALRMLAEDPNLAQQDPYVACAIGDESVVRQFIADEPAWANRSGGPLNLPPLVAIAHSSLLRVPEFRARLHRTARLLLDAGADPNQSIGNRWPPASLSEPSSDSPLSALYGAAGQHHDPELTSAATRSSPDFCWSTVQAGRSNTVSVTTPCGTLAWASCNEPMRSGDWVGCAEALVAHGMPGAQRDPDAPDCVLIDGQHKQFSEEVTEYLLGVRSG